MAASTTPIGTYKTYLMYKATTAATQYTKLVDIKNFPDLGGEPERIDVTTLSDRVRKYIAGVQDIASMQFTANYTAADFNKLNNLTGSQREYAVWIGATTSNSVDTPTGDDGKFSWTGDLVVYKTGGDVNAAQEMSITVYPSTEIAFTSAAT